jgi:outer membrane immunogenic protein
MTRSILLGAASAIALTASANAADLYRAPAGGYKDGPYVPAATWTGFYLGVNGGYAGGENSQYAVPGFDGVKADGGFGGGQLGYNWQGLWHKNVVLGIEADFQGADISGAKDNANGVTFSTDMDWFSTVRGRVGYGFDRALVYFTGGFAFGGLKHKIDLHDSKSVNPVFDDTATGFVLGGGLEYKFTPAWSIKAEYQYLNFGTNRPSDLVDEGNAIKEDNFHTARVGLNYHLAPSYEPLK